MKKYKVLLNWYGENLTFWTHTTSPLKAEINAMNKLAKKVQMNKYYVRQYFYGRQNKITIEEVKKV